MSKLNELQTKIEEALNNGTFETERDSLIGELQSFVNNDIVLKYKLKDKKTYIKSSTEYSALKELITWIKEKTPINIKGMSDFAEKMEKAWLVETHLINIAQIEIIVGAQVVKDALNLEEYKGNSEAYVEFLDNIKRNYFDVAQKEVKVNLRNDYSKLVKRRDHVINELDKLSTNFFSKNSNGNIPNIDPNSLKHIALRHHPKYRLSNNGASRFHRKFNLKDDLSEVVILIQEKHKNKKKKNSGGFKYKGVLYNYHLSQDGRKIETIYPSK